MKMIKLNNHEMDKESVISNAITISLVSQLKDRLEANADRLIEPLLKKEKPPLEDKECYKAIVALSHIQDIEHYINNL